MDEENFAKSTIVVVGLGLMGGSLALRLKARGCRIFAIDPDPGTRDYALFNHFAECVSADPAELVPFADVIILSAPVDEILAFIPSLPDLHPGSPIVLDLGSTKVQICKAFSNLPPRFESVGGHPMCGKAVSGIQNADPALFQGSAFAFTSISPITTAVRRFAVWLAEALGAKPVWLDPDIHDRWVAVTSHLPYLISSVLALVTPTEAFQLVGSGFLSTSRLASSPSSIMLPILETNREYVLEHIAQFRKQLDALENELEREQYPNLAEMLDQARKRKALLTTLQS